MKHRDRNKSGSSETKNDNKENVPPGLLYVRTDTRKDVKTSVLVERNVITAQASDAAISAGMSARLSK